MRILIFSQYYHPEQFLINEITPELVKHGHSVTVVTGLPNYPSGVIDKNYKNKKNRRETVNGVNIIRCPIISRGKNKIQLLLNYISFMFSANRTAKKIKDEFDVVLSYQLTPIFQVYPAIKYAKRHRLKLLLYNLDLAPMSGSGYAKGKFLLSSVYAKFSKWAMNACDCIAVTSESFIEYNHRVNEVPVEKMVYLPQHASNLLRNTNMDSVDNGIVDFMFAGNVAGGTGLDTIVDAAQRLKEEAVFRVHIVGEGSYLQTLKEKVDAATLSDYFVFHGRHPLHEMPKFYQLADVLLITLRPGQITIPAKLQAYMTTKKPIFGSMDGSGKDLINLSGCGVCVSAGDGFGLYKIMKDFIENPKTYESCGQKGLEYFQSHFTLDMFINKLLKLVSDLV